MKIDIGHSTRSTKWQVYLKVGDCYFWHDAEYDTPDQAIQLRDQLIAQLESTELALPSVHKFVPSSFYAQAPCTICGKKNNDSIHNVS